MENREEINRLKREISDCIISISNFETFRANLIESMRNFVNDKYASLDKALAEYGSFDEIHNAYGYDIISTRMYNKLKKLYEDRQKDPTERYVADVLEFLDTRLSDMKGNLDILRHALEIYEIGEK